MKAFQLNLPKLGLLLLPTFLRRPVITSFLSAATAPLRLLTWEFNNNREKVQYKLNHSGQVCYLRKVLNDAFGYSREEGFEIDDVYTAEILPDWIITYNEIDDLNKNHIPIAGNDETGLLTAYDEEYIEQISHNMYIYYPDNLSDHNMRQVKGLVNSYKLAGRKPVYAPKSHRK